ncbi:hypothetical protein ACLG6S_05605 [Thermodesulfobacteriota bacterium B35]
MTPVFDVPFLPEEEYVEFLVQCADELDSVHFAPAGHGGLDQRVRVGGAAADRSLVTLLGRLNGPSRYLLLNSRFCAPEILVSGDGLQELVRSMRELVERGLLDGIVYSDHYLLQRLADLAPDLAAVLEAVPSVNCMLDSFARIQGQLTWIRATGFRAPGRIVLDRSLNRDLDRLASVARQCRHRWPQMKIGLLANEGCLYHCPYKLSHDAYISLANLQGRDRTFTLNQELGCLRILGERPHRILQSPFIRPEDLELYLCHVDTIKLCGRTLGASFLVRLLTAYIRRRYDGNLLDLLDAVHWLADRIHIDNSALSFDFASMLSGCDNRCGRCGFCLELFESISCLRPVSLDDRRAAVD